MKKLILAIETSCDDTGIALVEASGTARTPRFRVLKNLVSSQIKIHRPFGGVVPNLAKREHIKNLPILYRKIFGKEHMAYSKSSKSHTPFAISPMPDIIAVTVGPGLEPALWAGITFAQELAKKYKKPLLGTNHLEGHLYSFLLTEKVLNVRGVRNVVRGRLKQAERSNKRSDQTSITFPAIALIVSGGHTILLKMKDLTHWKKLGETRDDAAGEAFDKVARLLGLPYPGGPEIEKNALKGNCNAIPFPQPMRDQKNYDFSFSGLKTSVLYYLRDKRHVTSDKERRDIAASFEKAVTEVLTYKTLRAAREFGAQSIILCGGVAANKLLRKKLKKGAREMGVAFFVPSFEFNNDNAAMIAAAGYMSMLRKKNLPMKARGDLGI